MTNLNILLFTIITTFSFGKIYIFLWKKLNFEALIPSGFGIFLPLIFILYASFSFGFTSTHLLSYQIIMLAGIFYLIDDIKGLPPKIRLSLSFIFGIFISWILIPDNAFIGYEIFIFLLICGFFSVSLTNMINFYDGSDLNIATLIFLTSTILLFYIDKSESLLENLGILMMGFSLGFGLINKNPSSLYFGDSGSFILALIFLHFTLAYFFNFYKVPPEIIVVLALPIFDVFYVMLIRLYYKHDMLSRNYLHLYQRLNIIYGSFFHLAPQIINVIVVLIFSSFMETFGLHKLSSVFFSCILVTPFLYILCRYIFVEKSYFFGDGKSSE